MRKQQCGQGDRLTCEPSLYRFDNVAWTLSGPILLPWTQFNRQRNRLFFFWSQEVLARTDPGALNLRRMPTALERAGNFSQTVDNSGRRIFIRDPERQGGCSVNSGGAGCFDGNIIPANRIDPTGQALLDLFPLPNATDPSGANQYNYAYNWRIGRRFAIDAGVRFYYLTPTRSQGDQVAQFEAERFDPAAAPLLYGPTTVGGSRRAINPATGDVLPALWRAVMRTCGWEIVAFEWRDLDLAARRLTVQRSDWLGHVTVPKGGRSRPLPLTQRLTAALKTVRHLRCERV